MKREIWDGTELVEVEVPDVRRGFRLEDVCPEDSECLRARLEYLGVERGAGSGEQGAGSGERGAGSRERGAWSGEPGAGSREIEDARRVTVRRSVNGQMQFAHMRRFV